MVCQKLINYLKKEREKIKYFNINTDDNWELILTGDEVELLIEQNEVLKEIFNLIDGAWDSIVISEDLYNKIKSLTSH